MIRRRQAVAATGLAFAIALAGRAPALHAESLTEAMAMTYRTNPELQAARRALGAVNEQVPQALAGWRPEVTVSGEAGRQRLEQQSAFFTDTVKTTPFSAQAEVRQPLYRGGRTVAETEEAVGRVGAERARLLATQQDILLRAVTAYMDVWRDQAIVRLNENNVEVLRRQLEATQDRFEVGEVTRTDVSQAESRLSGAIADRVGAEGALESSRATYKEVIGRLPGELNRPEVPAPLPEGRADAIARAEGHNPEVRAARFDEIAAQRAVRAVQGELLPEAELVGRINRSENNTSEESSVETLELVAQLTVPLYQSGAVFSRVREAKQVANQRRLDVLTARRTASQEAVSAWEDLEAARARITSFEDQIRAAEIALEGVREESRVGARTVLDVLDAEQELLNAEVNRVRAQRDRIVAAYRLLAAVGRLTAKDRDLPVAVFDADREFQAVRNRLWGDDLPAAAKDD